MQDNAIQPIMQAKESLQIRLQSVLDQAAGLRKKIEALNLALDVLRSSDTELADLPPASSQSVNSKRVYLEDPELVRTAVSECLGGLAGHKASKKQLLRYVISQNIECSEYQLTKVLKQHFSASGERERTVYSELVEASTNEH